MELEDKKDEIICLQASLIDKKRNLQYIKRSYEIKEKEILSEMAKLQNKIKQKQEQIEPAIDFMEEIYIGEKPLTDLILERQMEKDIEEEMERLEKAHEEIQKDYEKK